MTTDSLDIKLVAMGLNDLATLYAESGQGTPANIPHHKHKTRSADPIRVKSHANSFLLTAPRSHEDSTRLGSDGYDLSACGYAQAGIRAAQELLGRRDVDTTLIYACVLNRGGRDVRSQADGLGQHASRSSATLTG